MKVLSSTKWIPAQAGDTFVQVGVEYTLANPHTIRTHGAEVEYFALPKGTIIKKLSEGMPAEWEVTLPLRTPVTSTVRPISRRQLVQVLTNPEAFTSNTLERPSKDYRPYALALSDGATISEGLGVMLRLPSSRIPLPLPYTGQSDGRGMYKALDSLPVWARVIVPDDRTGPLGVEWERLFQKTPQGWRDCGLRRERA